MVLFGFRGKRTSLGTAFRICAHCQRPCSQAVARIQRWFTLFFIPVFPFSTRYVTVCSMCSAATRVDRARAEELVSSAGPPATSQVDPSSGDGVRPS